MVNLLCSTLNTLAPDFAQIFDIMFNCPGLSGIVIVNVVICHALTKSLIKIDEIIFDVYSWQKNNIEILKKYF